MDYKKAQKILNGKTTKKVANNTYLIWTFSCICLVFHKTIILSFYENKILYNTGGYFTNSTKDRLNRFGLQSIKIYKQDFSWYFTYRGKQMVFLNGMIFNYNGTYLNKEEQWKIL
jgi:hypothetical protein